MKSRVLVAVVGIPALLLVLLVLPQVVTAILIAAVSVIAVYELMHNTGLADQLYLMIAAAIMAIAVSFWSYGGCPWPAAIVGMILFWIALAAILIASHGEIPFSQLSIAAFSGIIVPLLLSSVTRILMLSSGRYLVLLPLVICFSADSGAYFVGVAFGKHKMAPILSPKKSWEGAAGGVLSAVVLTVVYAMILDMAFGMTVRYAAAVVYGLLGSVVSILGDLLFSAIKRQTGIKDYSHILPGHGGMLDRFDSMTLVAPLTEALLLTIPMIVM